MHHLYQAALESFAPEVGDGQKLALNTFSWGTFALNTPMESVALLWLLASAHLRKEVGGWAAFVA